jgi:hypothetical protein
MEDQHEKYMFQFQHENQWGVEMLKDEKKFEI